MRAETEPARRSGASVRTALATPGAPPMVAWSIVARLGVAMLNLSVLFFVRAETGSYSLAGALSAASLVGTAAGTVAQGRLIDRFGPTRPLLALTAPHAALGASVIAGIASGLSAALLAAAIVAQAATLPSVAVASRSMWAHLVPEGGVREAAYAYEAMSFEVCWLLGPAIASVLSTVWWPGSALVVSLALTVTGAVGFALTRAVRAIPGARRAPRRPRREAPAGTVRWNGALTLLAAASGLGIGVGFVVVGVTAGTAAFDVPALAGVLLTAWSTSSVVAGLLYQRRPWPTAVTARLPVLMAGFGAALLVPVGVPGLAALAVATVVAGSTLVAQVTTHNLVLDGIVPGPRLAEGYGWLVTVVMLMIAAGQAIGGWIAELGDYRTCFLAGAACVFALAAVVRTRASTLVA